MSSNERRQFKRTAPQQPTNQRQGIRKNLPQSNLQNTVRQSQNRIRNIKSPFASDQTKTIANKPKQTKKRAVGQIPLRDRQHGKLQVNQKQSSGIAVRKLPQKAVTQQKKVIKKVQKQVRKPNQFNRKNKSRAEIDQVFNFDANERGFF